MTSDPKRLTVVGATDLERTLLQAARRERPSPELTARMAAGLGISAAAALTAAAPAAGAAPVAAAKASLAAWVPAGVLAAAVAAGVVGVRLSAPPAPAVHADRPAPAVVTPRQEAPVVVAPAAAERRVERVRKRPAPAVPGPGHGQVQVSDLRDQIALIDAARTAVKARSTERALVLLHRYDASFPAGTFRPEALALRIEALDEAGRTAEAEALARDFLARYPQSPLADRVAKIARRQNASQK